MKKIFLLIGIFLLVLSLVISAVSCGCDPTRVTTNHADLVTASSARLNGVVTAPYREVQVFFKWGSHPTMLFNTTTPEVRQLAGSFSYTITGLTPGTTYYFQAFGNEGSNVGNVYGEILPFTTVYIPDVTPIPPTPPTVTPVPTPTPIPTPTSRPIAEWHFEGSDKKVEDSSGNENHGTLMGDTRWTDGPESYGKALAFDGDGDYVEIANESNFDFDKDNAFTIEAYIKTDSDDTLIIVSKMPILKPARGYQLIKHSPTIDDIDPDGGNRIYLFLSSVHDSADGYANTDSIVVYGSTDVADGEWHHVKVTYDGSATAAGIQIYIDWEPEVMHTRTHGENKGLWDTLSGSILNNLPIQISGRDGDDVAWDGLIDEVIIWEGVR